jgi:hypothetical protein
MSDRGATAIVDFHSTKPTYPVSKCHLNAMVADTKQWEQSAGFALDLHPAVLRWVKNDHLGFLIPYRKQALAARYIPDFIAVLENGLQLIIEIKGQYSDDADIKAKAAERWVSAMNHLGDYGTLGVPGGRRPARTRAANRRPLEFSANARRACSVGLLNALLWSQIAVVRAAALS